MSAPFHNRVAAVSTLVFAASLLVVGSLPESGAEVGDEQGRDALRRLEKIFGRGRCEATEPASYIGELPEPARLPVLIAYRPAQYAVSCSENSRTRFEPLARNATTWGVAIASFSGNGVSPFRSPIRATLSRPFSSSAPATASASPP